MRKLFELGRLADGQHRAPCSRRGNFCGGKSEAVRESRFQLTGLEVCRMSPLLDTSCRGTASAKPRSGILVDCQRFENQIRKSAPASLTAVPAANPAGPPPALHSPPKSPGAAPWRLTLAAAVIGLLFLLTLTSAAMYLCAVSESAACSLQRVADSQLGLSSHSLAVPASDAQVVVSPASVKTMAWQDDLAPPAQVKPGPRTTTTALAKAASVSDPAAELESDTALENVDLSKSAASTCDSETCNTTVAGKGTGDFFGTAVTFLATPKIAGSEALKQHKLLFVLHVSGNFEDPGFT
jgi:hypothetical protein